VADKKRQPTQRSKYTKREVDKNIVNFALEFGKAYKICPDKHKDYLYDSLKKELAIHFFQDEPQPPE